MEGMTYMERTKEENKQVRKHRKEARNLKSSSTIFLTLIES
jgi:hypothetical protein